MPEALEQAPIGIACAGFIGIKHRSTVGCLRKFLPAYAGSAFRLHSSVGSGPSKSFNLEHNKKSKLYAAYHSTAVRADHAETAAERPFSARCLSAWRCARGAASVAGLLLNSSVLALPLFLWYPVLPAAGCYLVLLYCSATRAISSRTGAVAVVMLDRFIQP